ncbi:sulfotransferase domain-containing protein [Marinomonas atlantica]|uniref:sulfotransferase domain-containing protein n=1 Tax=Marinomonas atlantica TaxID=1806668 RepID=UPI0008319A1E|nr:sulfotransferase domain-containing protein [Marinomonas atlantica]
MQHPRANTVISLQRTGFSLMLSILNEILRRKQPIRSDSDNQQHLIQALPFLSHQTNLKYKQFFAQRSLADRLLFNGEFQLLVGGPKWVDPKYPDDIFVRKYFGVKDLGDFLMVVRYPKILFDYYPIMHSTKGPADWLASYGIDGCNWLTSYRNPMDVFNSAAHSINALTSEYIQCHLKHEDETSIRAEIGLSKLSDPKVCKGLLKYQIDYWRDYFPIAKHFQYYRWEDLILNPASTIQELANMVGVTLTEEEAISIWKPRDHRNLLNHHSHNFRINKGIVNDWKNSVIPEHIELFKELGGEDIFKQLGYDWPKFDQPLNEYQRLIQQYWHSDAPYLIEDKNLAGFAFNKSNIDASDYSFESFAEMGRVSIERSDLKDQALLMQFHEYAADINEQLVQVIEQLATASSDHACESILRKEYGEQSTTNFLSVLRHSPHELEANIEDYLNAHPDRPFTIWGMGSDFNRWIKHSDKAKSLIARHNLSLADRARAGESLYGKAILSPDEALSLTESAVLPFVFGYETRHAILQQCQRFNVPFIDLHTCLKDRS